MLFMVPWMAHAQDLGYQANRNHRFFQREVVDSGCCQVGRPMLAERPVIHTLYLHSLSLVQDEKGVGPRDVSGQGSLRWCSWTLPCFLFPSTTSPTQARLSPQITKHYWECCIFTRLQKQGNYRMQKPCKASRRKNICGHVLMQAVYDASNKWVQFGKALVWFIIFNYPSLLTLWCGASHFRRWYHSPATLPVWLPFLCEQYPWSHYLPSAGNPKEALMRSTAPPFSCLRVSHQLCVLLWVSNIFTRLMVCSSLPPPKPLTTVTFRCL